MTNVATPRARLWRDTPFVLSFLLVCSSAHAQEALLARGTIPSSIESSGPQLMKPPAGGLEAIDLNQSRDAFNELPLPRIQQLSAEPSVGIVGSNRSARDAEIYRVTAPSVVKILTNSGFGTVFGIVDSKSLPVCDYAGFAPFGFGYRRCPGEQLTINVFEDFLSKVWHDKIVFRKLNLPNPGEVPIGPNAVIVDDLGFTRSA